MTREELIECVKKESSVAITQAMDNNESIHLFDIGTNKFTGKTTSIMIVVGETKTLELLAAQLKQFNHSVKGIS